MMSENKELVPTPEIDQLGQLNERLSNEDIRNTLKKIELISRKMEVGQQTSYQNKFFVLNPVEFPEGTSGKSRQAIFEAAVRVDVLKGHLFEHKKINGEMKIIEARLLRAKKKLEGGDEADRLEAEGEIIIAEAEYRQKELSLESIEAKANQVLRQINDFYEEFIVNEELCQKRGFNYELWNTMEVENDYWNTVNDRKIQKAAAYSMLGMGQQLGDSLPLQNNLDPNRIEFVKNTTVENIKGMLGTPDQSTGQEPNNNEIEDKSKETIETWTVSIPGGATFNAGNNGELCMCRDSSGICHYRSNLPGKCTKRYCASLGLTSY